MHQPAKYLTKYKNKSNTKDITVVSSIEATICFIVHPLNKQIIVHRSILKLRRVDGHKTNQ